MTLEEQLAIGEAWQRFTCAVLHRAILDARGRNMAARKFLLEPGGEWLAELAGIDTRALREREVGRWYEQGRRGRAFIPAPGPTYPQGGPLGGIDDYLKK